MPKKFKGENSKAVEARMRKAAKKAEETERKVKEAEDEYWRDDDKHAARKQHRKDDKERRRLEQSERKKEAQRLLDEEMSCIKPSKPEPSAKMTRADIERNKQRMAEEAAAQKKTKAQVSVDELPLEENVNRLEAEGEARTVEDAISVLSVKEPELDRHPEKRIKAAYQAYEDTQLPQLKLENPNMRLSQLKQMLKKDWMKSPDNPMNQRTRAYNEKK